MTDLDRENKENLDTYETFLGLTKWAILFVVAVLIGMAIFLL